MKGLELCKFGLCLEGEETLEGPGTVGCSRRTAVRKLGWGLEACRGRGRWRVLPHHNSERHCLSTQACIPRGWEPHQPCLQPHADSWLPRLRIVETLKSGGAGVADGGWRGVQRAILFFAQAASGNKSSEWGEEGLHREVGVT